MDFLTTARLLLDIDMRQPNMTYTFDDCGNVVIQIPVEDGVPADFELAKKMFEPV